MDLEMEIERYTKANNLYKSDINDLEIALKQYKVENGRLCDDSEKMHRKMKKL